jgi:hypothetical protein
VLHSFPPRRSSDLFFPFVSLVFPYVSIEDIENINLSQKKISEGL